MLHNCYGSRRILNVCENYSYVIVGSKFHLCLPDYATREAAIHPQQTNIVTSVAIVMFFFILDNACN